MATEATTNRDDDSMNWVMILWLVAFITIVLFGVGAYIFNTIFFSR